jgi:trans-aconitate 2-methyltransferase
VREVLNTVASELGGSPDPWYFPGVAEVESELRATGFDLDGGFVRLVHQRRSVPDLAAFTGWLDSQVLIAYQPSLPPDTYEQFRRLALERFSSRGPRDDGTFDQDYVRMDLMVTKPED